MKQTDQHREAEKRGYTKAEAEQWLDNLLKFNEKYFDHLFNQKGSGQDE